MMKVAIQGGKGSFNEQAMSKYLSSKGLDWKVLYAYNTSGVFDMLKSGESQYGLFALLNGVGGLVEESLSEISKQVFTVIDTINLPISHHLMAPKNSKKLDSIIAHPQVFKQCRDSLSKSYSDYKQIVGEGDMIDNARAGQAVANGELGGSVAFLGPEMISDIYDMPIIKHNLEDSSNNVTTFVLVEL